MERIRVHELSAAYALDALDAAERREFEEHLRHCPECQETVPSFQEAASALAFQAEMPPPPTALRDRILDQARRERGNVVALRPRWPFRAAAAVAAVAAAAAIGLGVWAASLHNELGQRPEAVPLTGASGSLILTEDDEATLVVRDLPPAPTGKTYEAWVIESGKPTPAGTFAGGDRVAFPLTRAVGKGAVVAVTLERAGGVDHPTSKPLITSEPV